MIKLLGIVIINIYIYIYIYIYDLKSFAEFQELFSQVNSNNFRFYESNTKK